jgi:fumarate hydratase class I
MTPYKYSEPIQLSEDTTAYRLLTRDFVSESEFEGRKILRIEREGLRLLAMEAFHDVSFYLRGRHLEKLRRELDDPAASENDRFVIYTLLQNACVAAGGQLPSCQDTGTAIVMGKKGQQVWTDGPDAEALSHGIYQTFQESNLRYSQIAPLSMFEEKNTGDNMPAQIDIAATEGDTYKLVFVAKGGGSANKSFLYQMTKSLLNEESLTNFVAEKFHDIGTAACPPYHIALVIGGPSAETNLKIVKLATCGELDQLPTTGDETGRAFRDPEWEERVGKLAESSHIGAQFGGKYFAHDVRVVRMTRHAASCPVGLGVSCSADRNIKAKITRDGIFLEQLEFHPEKYMPAEAPEMAPPVRVDLNQPMPEILKTLSRFPIKTRLSLTGPVVVARDIAHAKIGEMLDSGAPMPEYFKNHPIYYAGPAKTPEGMPTGSFGPTTAGRMDPYVQRFQGQGGSMVMLAKGNRSGAVTEACREHGGFYLGSIGGPAAILAQDNIKKVEIVDFPELGMEAVRKIEVENFPAFIVVDDKGNDFFQKLD